LGGIANLIAQRLPVVESHNFAIFGDGGDIGNS
jgi:hypothetical protein